MNQYHDEWYPPRIPRNLSPFEALVISLSIVAAFFVGFCFGGVRP